ncbi:MAG TPA: membrane protein insertion efficiency factor YidD, partial [Bacteroidetes bacterium]|nr:membrane protein insertion efficiency factor YidD [Bacteroidota bacterium]
MNYKYLKGGFSRLSKIKAKWKISLFLFILSFSYTPTLFSQKTNDIENFRNLFSIQEHHHNWSHYLKESDNEFKIFFSFLFIVYKELFSSQDMDSCVFTPSCSVYAIESIEQKGVFLGTLSAFD